MIKDSVLNLKVLNKLFANFSNEGWVMDYFNEFLEYSLGVEDKIEFVEIEDEKVTIINSSGIKIDIYVLNDSYSKDVIFVYEINYSDKEDVAYGILIKDKYEIMDLYCHPYNSLKRKKVDYQGKFYNINSGTDFVFEEMIDEAKEVIEDNMFDEQFRNLINKMLKKENLLVKNGIMRVF